jgi:hypothetical protein
MRAVGRLLQPVMMMPPTAVAGVDVDLDLEGEEEKEHWARAAGSGQRSPVEHQYAAAANPVSGGPARP